MKHNVVESFFAGCAGKNSFPSAQAAYRSLQNRRALKGGKAYACEFCNQWHVTRGRR